MVNSNFSDEKEIVSAMAKVVLNEVLNAVIVEFEKRADLRIGAISVSAKHKDNHKRDINIDIQHIGEDCLTGLAEYRKVLCQHEPFKNSTYCERSR